MVVKADACRHGRRPAAGKGDAGGVQRVAAAGGDAAGGLHRAAVLRWVLTAISEANSRSTAAAHRSHTADQPDSSVVHANLHVNCVQAAVITTCSLLVLTPLYTKPDLPSAGSLQLSGDLKPISMVNPARCRMLSAFTADLMTPNINTCGTSALDHLPPIRLTGRPASTPDQSVQRCMPLHAACAWL